MSELKLCKDCKFAKIGWMDWFLLDGYKFAKCTYKDSIKPPDIDPVTGHNVAEYNHFCSTMRESYGSCKREAINFVPKYDPDDPGP